MPAFIGSKQPYACGQTIKKQTKEDINKQPNKRLIYKYTILFIIILSFTEEPKVINLFPFK